MEPRGASMTDHPARKSETGGGLLSEGRQDLVPNEVNTAVNGPKPSVLYSTSDLVGSNSPADELSPRYAPVLAIREGPDDPVDQSSTGFYWHSQHNPAVDRSAPESAA
jgi:hypothetical protein